MSDFIHDLEIDDSVQTKKIKKFCWRRCRDRVYTSGRPPLRTGAALRCGLRKLAAAHFSVKTIRQRWPNRTKVPR